MSGLLTNRYVRIMEKEIALEYKKYAYHQAQMDKLQAGKGAYAGQVIQGGGGSDSEPKFKIVQAGDEEEAPAWEENEFNPRKRIKHADAAMRKDKYLVVFEGN